MGGPRGRLTSLEDRRMAVKLISEARKNGARLEPACKILGISIRTHQRWVKEGLNEGDQRSLIERKPPANKLSKDERQKIIEIL